MTNGTTAATATLWIVGTPIGNLEDITVRATRVLKTADRLLAEDTRRTKNLLQHLGILRRVEAFHAHTERAKADDIVASLAQGVSVALVTDAGTPAISDPGQHLVARARAAGISVVPIPGPSAAVTALSAAGIPCAAFRFIGFLPRKGKRRREVLDSIASTTETTVFFEAPTRLVGTLQDLSPRLSDRTVVVCRELTKIHEEFQSGSASGLATHYAAGVKGEVTVVVAGAAEEKDTRWELDAVEERLVELTDGGMPPSAVAKQVAKESGHGRSDLFRMLVRLKGDPDALP